VDGRGRYLTRDRKREEPGVKHRRVLFGVAALAASLAVVPLLAVVLRRPGPRDYTELPEFRAIVGDYVL
jgi:hypothetical protein